MLAPVGVMAAAARLVDIADPILDRKVRVGNVGSLRVERPGVTSGAINVSHVDIQSLSPRNLAEVTAPTRITLSELTVGVHTMGNPVIGPTVLEISQYVRDTRTTVPRRVTLKTDETLHLKLDGPPLIVPVPAAGKKYCLAAKLYQWAGETKVDVGATVFTYS